VAGCWARQPWRRIPSFAPTNSRWQKTEMTPFGEAVGNVEVCGRQAAQARIERKSWKAPAELDREVAIVEAFFRPAACQANAEGCGKLGLAKRERPRWASRGSCSGRGRMALVTSELSCGAYTVRRRVGPAPRSAVAGRARASPCQGRSAEREVTACVERCVAQAFAGCDRRPSRPWARAVGRRPADRNPRYGSCDFRSVANVKLDLACGR